MADNAVTPTDMVRQTDPGPATWLGNLRVITASSVKAVAWLRARGRGCRRSGSSCSRNRLCAKRCVHWSFCISLRAYEAGATADRARPSRAWRTPSANTSMSRQPSRSPTAVRLSCPAYDSAATTSVKFPIGGIIANISSSRAPARYSGTGGPGTLLTARFTDRCRGNCRYQIHCPATNLKIPLPTSGRAFVLGGGRLGGDEL